LPAEPLKTFYTLAATKHPDMIILDKISTKAPKEADKKKFKKETEKYIARMIELQNILYAQSKYSLLIIAQGLDAAGKDGLIKGVFSGMNPSGCRVHSFKVPTAEEAAHDFLWRVHAQTPPKGFVQIFNRSHYEDVLSPKVNGLISKSDCQRRYEHINSFEKLLIENNTVILKFYLHISHKEQLKRLDERLSDPAKSWKYSNSDITVSAQWDSYMKAYEDIFKHCNSSAGWHIVPSDHNWYKDYYVAKTIVEAMEALDLKYPKHAIVQTAK